MSVITLAKSNTQRLTTVEAVLAELPANDQLLFIEDLIDQASAAIARSCGTILAFQLYRETQLGAWITTDLFLRYWPLVTVGPVSYATDAGPTPITDYRIESAMGGIVYRRQGWWLPYYGSDEWQIDYGAGYHLPEQTVPVDPLTEELPADLERACIETCKVWFHERLVGSRVASKSFGLTGDRIDYGVQAQRRALPMLCQDLIEPWRRVRIA